jgi:CRISPR/Cas system CMR-associated protein Cmr5 small subunit
MTARRVDQGMAVAAAEALPAKVDSELRTRYRHLRIMLHTAGLAATYAYIASKSRDADGGHDTLASAYQAARMGIVAQLKDKGLLDSDATDTRQVLARLGGMGPVEYARASAETAAFIGWLSRLADAEWQDGNAGA